MALRFRPAAAGDLPEMQSLARRTIDASYRDFIDDDGVDWFIAGPADEYLEGRLGRAIVATTGDRIVGLAVLQGNLIDLILIDDPLQRRGYGSRLLGHCESVLFRSYDTLRLESFEGNAGANRFYRRHGWTRTGWVADARAGNRKWVFEKRRDTGAHAPRR